MIGYELVNAMSDLSSTLVSFVYNRDTVKKPTVHDILHAIENPHDERLIGNHDDFEYRQAYFMSTRMHTKLSALEAHGVLLESILICDELANAIRKVAGSRYAAFFCKFHNPSKHKDALNRSVAVFKDMQRAASRYRDKATTVIQRAWSVYSKRRAASTIIQRAWRQAYSDPKHALCRRRLLNEYAEFEKLCVKKE